MAEEQLQQQSKMALIAMDNGETQSSNPYQPTTVVRELAPMARKGRSKIAITDTFYFEIENLRDSLFKFGRRDLVLRVFVICLFLFDIATDWWTAYRHHKHGDSLFFYLTLTFVIVPGVITSVVSFKYYYTDESGEKYLKNKKKITKKWAIRAVFLGTILSPVLRDIECIWFGLKMKNAESKNEKMKYYRKMSYEDSDTSMLKLMLSCMEDAPQLLLQFYIFASPARTSAHAYEETYLIVSMIFSLLGMTASIACYHKNLRSSIRSESEHLSILVTLIVALYTVLILLARILALGLFAVYCPVALFCVLGHRWIVMTTWIFLMNYCFNAKRVDGFLTNLILGGILVFAYINPVNSPTKLRQLFFYLYSFLENTILIVFWFHDTGPERWYRVPAISTQIGCYFVGILVLIFYHLFCHPKLKIGLNLKTEEYVPKSETN